MRLKMVKPCILAKVLLVSLQIIHSQSKLSERVINLFSHEELIIVVSNNTKPIIDLKAAKEKCEPEDQEINSQGKVTWKDGSYFEGCWNNGKRSGRGTMVWANGDTFTGQWKEGIRSGMGNMTWKDGTTYVGHWGNDMMNGQGIFEKKGLRKYTGYWKNGDMYGVGECTFLDSRNKNQRYTGDFSHSYMDGTGTYTYIDGSYFTGQFTLDKKNGTGAFYWKEGYYFKGLWQDGFITGYGKMVLPDNIEIDGEFTSSNKLFSGSKCCNNYDVSCFLLYNDLTLYQGECKRNPHEIPDGYGRITYGYNRVSAKDQKYYGHWNNGKRDGLGLCYFNDDKVFFGNFLKDNMSGNGLLLENDRCYKVKTKKGVVSEKVLMPDSKKECQFKIEGRKTDKKKYINEICEEEADYEYDEDYSEEEETLTIVKYNITHCQQLNGRYCNQVISYEGGLVNGLKSGLGMQKFDNGSIYYGNFTYDNMHGIGSMILPNSIYTSGNMNMDSFDYGLILYPNLTLFGIMKDKVFGMELVHQIEIESGITKCTEFHKNKPPKLECSTETDVTGFYYKLKGDSENGFCSQDKRDIFYRGQILNGNWYGLGYIWKKHNPTYIGMIEHGRLNSHGLRILYSEDETMGLLLGYWKKGRLFGPGISISKTAKFIGNFKAPLPNKFLSESEKLKIYIPSNNAEFLGKIHMKKPNISDK